MVGFVVVVVAVGIGVRLGCDGGVWICRLWVALMVVRICIWVVFVFVFLVDGGMRYDDVGLGGDEVVGLGL